MAKAQPIPTEPRPKFAALVFPGKGLDRSLSHEGRRPGTTSWARNIRCRPPKTSRYGGGKRPGLARLNSNQLTGDNSSTQVNHIAVLPTEVRGQNTAGLQAIRIVEDFTNSPMRTGTNPSDLPYDLVVFRRDYITGGNHLVKVNWRTRVQKTDLSGAPDLTPLPTGVPGGLVVDWRDEAAGGYPGVAVQYQTTNDITVAMYAARTTSNTAGNGAGDQAECMGMGPFIRGSALLDKKIGACLTRVGPLQVRLDIIEVSGATRTLLSSSDTATIDGVPWGSGSTMTTADLFIRIYEQGGTITARCSWASAGFGTAADPADLGGLHVAATTSGAGTGDALPGSNTDIPSDGPATLATSGGGTVPTRGAELSCSTSTTDLAGNNRGGFAALFTAGGAASSVNNRWYFRSIIYHKLVPAAVGVLNTFDRNSRPIIAARYFIPPSCTGCAITTAGVFQSNGGTEWHAIDDNLAGINHPYVDGAIPVVKGNTAALRSSYVQISPLDVTYSGRYQVEVKGRHDELAIVDVVDTDTEDVPGAALRLSTDLKSGIFIEVLHGSGYEPDKPYANLSSHLDHYTTIRFVGIANGARYVLDTFQATAEHMPPWRGDWYQRWHDNGQATLAALTVDWRINGMVLRTFTPSSMAGWAAFFAALGGTAKTQMNTSKLCGIAFGGDDAPPPNWYSWGGRIVNADAESQGQSSDTYEADIFAFLPGWIYKGSTAGGAFVAIPGGTGAGLKNASITTAFLGNLLFMADGGQCLYTGADNFIGVAPLVAEEGTAPTGFKLLAAFLGRLVVAGFHDAPMTYYMSRAGDALDWDYGADPPESAALAGTDEGLGLPPEPITALITMPGDVLIMGCVSRIFMIVGDPGISGRMLLRTAKTGILGAHAWCFDDHNNLYFIGGAGGLWVLPADGSEPQNIDHGRWGDDLAKIDGATHAVRMCFDPVDRLVYVFTTPIIAGVACVHFVYSVLDDACLEDVYDQEDGANYGYLNPYAAAQADTSTASHRHAMIGCQDGYVRRFSDSVFYDEATAGTQLAFACEVDVYPDSLPSTVETLAHELHIVLDKDSSAVTAYWFSGNDEQTVADLVVGSEAQSWSLAGGYNAPLRVRSRGAAHKLRLVSEDNAASFCIAAIAASFAARGRRR